jgi:glucosyl-dolichyl phosphate glucuronosyltransferase
MQMQHDEYLPPVTCVVSVIMINRNGGAFLRSALQSLRCDLEQTWSLQRSFEFLIIDNGSTDDSLSVIQHELANVPFPCKVYCELSLGVNSARNAGICQSNGDLLIFVDSDLNFHPGWLRGYLAAAAEFPQNEVFAGRVRVGCIEGSVPSWLDLTGPYCRPAIVVQLQLGDEIKVLRLTGDIGPVGPNMAFRRSLFKRVGNFDTRFGLRPGSLVPGAETEYFHRLTKTGVSFVYVPSAVVDHPVKADQLCKAYFLKRLRGTGRVNARIQRLDGLHYRTVFGVPRYLLKQYVVAVARYGAALFQPCPKKCFFRRGSLAVIAGQIQEHWSRDPDLQAPAAPDSQ